jgi:hydrogenase maturation protein HypF
MGRLLDGVAAILKICTHNSYEGEGAMLLESVAAKYNKPIQQPYSISITDTEINWSVCISEIIHDINSNKPIGFIAKKVFVTLAWLIHEVATIEQADGIAFSGGVFQNTLLIDLIDEIIGDEFELYFHRELSPNDECISFGQLAYSELNTTLKKSNNKNQLLLNH